MIVVKIMLTIDDSYKTTNSKTITKYKMISTEKTIPRHITVKQKNKRQKTHPTSAKVLKYPKEKDFIFYETVIKLTANFLTGKK